MQNHRKNNSDIFSQEQTQITLLSSTDKKKICDLTSQIESKRCSILDKN